jgi:hypothetical protein
MHGQNHIKPTSSINHKITNMKNGELSNLLLRTYNVISGKFKFFTFLFLSQTREKEGDGCASVNKQT